MTGAVGVITGISIFQALITPVVDAVKKSALQRIVSAIPGVGNAADSAVELVLGSALVIKNSIGVVLLILILVLCAAPLLKIGLIAGMLKCAAAFMGVVSDKRITSCVNRAGDGGLLLLKTTGTAILLFLISIAVVTASGKG
ncbi:MAG: stage III sporulation protein AE [Acetatifactor sp.]|nr:stage III sporulation protein AE [Acetatifactor sp.]